MINKDERPEKATSSLDLTGSAKTDSFRLKSLQALRRLAEKILGETVLKPTDSQRSLSSEKARQVIHELQVHQLEIKAQNEELQRTQVELELARERYFELYDLAPVGYCAIDEKGLVLEANLTAANLLGVEKDSLVGKPITWYVFTEDQESFYLYSKLLFASRPELGQEPVEGRADQTTGLQAHELRMVRENGTVFWVNWQEATAQWIDDEPVHWVVLSDITERKRIEAQQVRFEARNRHIQKAESLEQMAGAVSHLFNNHLQRVLGSLEIAQDNMATYSVAQVNVSRAIQAVRSASKVSTLLLTYLGQHNTKLAPLNLSEICQQNLPDIKAVIPNYITLTIDFVDPGPVVRANASQIQQILLNLVTNSWEAIGDRAGGIKIVIKTVHASSIPNSHISQMDWLATDEVFVCLEVTDTGCGMSQEEMEKIFDPFFTTKSTGRGLGLAVALGIIRAWGGVINVKSAIGEGSCFSVLLPLLVDVVPRQNAILPAHDNRKEGGVVLLVDDDRILCEVIEAVLKSLGFTVFVATDGNKAVALFEKHQDSIECLLTDLSMPGLDGWETLAAIRRIKPHLPAILSSGYDETKAMEGEHEEQPQAFLHKPYKRSDLQKVLAQILGTASH
ncbi:MAG: response regulator [Desulfobulbaceae bacterium]|nr:response regulator [Desulfobulbaceae bacterium]